MSTYDHSRFILFLDEDCQASGEQFYQDKQLWREKTVYNTVKHDILVYIVQICLLLLPVNIIMHTDTLRNVFIMISFTKCFSCALMT